MVSKPYRFRGHRPADADDPALKALRRAVDAAGGVKEAATALGVHWTYLYRVMSGARAVGPKLRAAMRAGMPAPRLDDDARRRVEETRDRAHKQAHYQARARRWRCAPDDLLSRVDVAICKAAMSHDPSKSAWDTYWPRKVEFAVVDYMREQYPLGYRRHAERKGVDPAEIPDTVSAARGYERVESLHSAKRRRPRNYQDGVAY
jgi:hypothetical protein